MEILIPVLILSAIAVLCALLLTLASIFFAVKEDERAAAIRDCLPGANCGACGFSGCDGYAKALSEGTATAPTPASAMATVRRCARMMRSASKTASPTSIPAAVWGAASARAPARTT